MSLMSEMSNTRRLNGKKRIYHDFELHTKPGMQKKVYAEVLAQIEPLDSGREDSWGRIVFCKEFNDIAVQLADMGVPDKDLHTGGAFALYGEDDTLTVFAEDDLGLL